MKIMNKRQILKASVDCSVTDPDRNEEKCCA